MLDPNEHCNYCRKIEDTEDRVLRVELQLNHLVEAVDSIKATLDTLVSDKQKLIGALGVIAVFGTALVWVAGKIIDKVLK